MPYATIPEMGPTIPCGAATVWLIDGERLEVTEALPVDGWLHMTFRTGAEPPAGRLSVPASQVRRVVYR
jgi:hypothetical protein